MWKVHKRKLIVLADQYFLLCHTASNLSLTSSTDGDNGHGDYGHGSGGSYGSYKEKSNFICKSMVYLQRTKMIFYPVFIMYFCFMVFYNPLLTSEVIYNGRAGCLWMTQKKWKKEILVYSKVLFQKAYKKPHKLTPDCQSVWFSDIETWEYLTLLGSTAKFNICL